MRPIRLVMHAFGPYASQQEIDFRKLQDRTLFLIHGPTGAGKTTILDAICFALYGDSSGGERSGKSLRSDHADPLLPTEVTFDFSLAGEQYRVFRRPEQERPKKKGDGIVKIKPEATLWKRTGLGESEEGTVLESQFRRVSERMQHLLGFKSEQFRQVVMLPQGQFRELLTANSKNRQTIMEVLFQTAFYRRVEDALKEAAKEVERQIKEKAQERDYLLRQAEVESGQELTEKLEADRSTLSKLTREVATLKTADKQAQDNLAHGRSLSERFEEHRDAEGALEKLGKRSGEFAEKRSILVNARHAATLVSDEKTLTDRTREAEAAAQRLNQARKALDRARVVKERSEVTLRKEKAREDERNDARKKLNYVDELTTKVGELDKALKASASAAKEKRAREKEFLAASEALEALTAILEQKRSALGDAEKTAAQIELLATRLDEAQRNARGVKELQSDRSALAGLERLSESYRNQRTEAEKSLSTARAELKALEKARLDGRAAILAKELIPGEPCPVCGSPEHPSPATWEHPLPEDEEIEAKAAEVDEHSETLEGLKSAQTEIEKKASEKRASVRLYEENLGELGGKDVKELRAELRKINEQLTRARKARETWKSLNQEIEGIEKRISNAKTDQTRAQEKLEEARTLVGQAEAVVTERLSGIPEDLRSLTALNRAKTKARETMDVLEEALEKAQQEFVTANEQFSGSVSALESAQDVAATAQQRAMTQKQEFTGRLVEAGFPDTEAFRNAKRSKMEIEQLEKDIDSYEGALSAAKDRAERAAKDVEGLQEPDIRSLADSAAKAKELLEKALKDEASLSERVARTARLLADFQAISKKLDSLESEYGVVGRISSVANGNNAEGITFQRFVLSALLDDVLYAASERLKIMSERRYALQRVRERADKRIAGGLDLEVLDAYTGTARPVATLSGGESFLASLALALGLADVVQSYAGGIHLDTIFVDEGFGTLDPEALDLAYRALADLQKSGRLVGIISHVPELKEQIPTRLEVTSARHGSSARFVTF